MNQLIFSFILFSLSSLALAGVNENPAIDLTLSFQQSGGTNGVAVAYNPHQKLYYAAIAGNPNFPLEVFDEAGNPLWQGTTGQDIRSLWFNKKEKRLEFVAYGGGLYYYPLDDNGYPSNGTELWSGLTPPGDQSVGTFDGKFYSFFLEGKIH